MIMENTCERIMHEHNRALPRPKARPRARTVDFRTRYLSRLNLQGDQAGRQEHTHREYTSSANKQSELMYGTRAEIGSRERWMDQKILCRRSASTDKNRATIKSFDWSAIYIFCYIVAAWCSGSNSDFIQRVWKMIG